MKYFLGSIVVSLDFLIPNYTNFTFIDLYKIIKQINYLLYVLSSLSLSVHYQINLDSNFSIFFFINLFFLLTTCKF